MLWGLVCLKKPFAKYKHRKEFEEAFLSRVDTLLVINRRWPLPIQDIITRSLTRDPVERPTMSEVCKSLNECASSGAEDCDFEITSILLSSTRKQLSKSLVLPGARLSSKGGLRKSVSATSIHKDYSYGRNYRRNMSDTSGTTECTYEDYLLQEMERRELWVRTKKITL
jgi:serine/threonine protein kinase